MSSTTNQARGLRQALAALIVVSAALFVVGVAREHTLHHSEVKPAATATEPTHIEGGNEDSHATEHTIPEGSTETHGESANEGRVLGVDIETWPIVIAFAAVSLGLAVALLRSRSRTVVAVAGLLSGVAAVFDIAESAHQAKESHASLVVIAVVVSALHIAAVAVAAMILKAEAPHEVDEIASRAVAN
jgi:hypothetical protein